MIATAHRRPPTWPRWLPLTRLPEGAELACGQASLIAHAMNVDVAACEVDELDVVVTVQAGHARAAARAGPIDGPN